MHDKKEDAADYDDVMEEGPAAPAATVLPTAAPLTTDGDDGPTLSEVLDSLGQHALQVACAGRQLDRSFGDSVVLGPGEPVRPAQGGLLLLTGGRPAHADTAKAVRDAAAGGYVGVVLKAFGDDLTQLVHVADELGIALLTTPDDMAWRHLDAMVAASRSVSVAGDTGTYSAVGLGDFFALANAIAAAVGGAITIEDTTGRVISYSNLPHHEIDEIRRLAILGRQTPERPTNRQEYQSILRAEGPVFFPSPGPPTASRMAIAVRAGTEVLGTIFVLTDRPPLAAGAESTLVDAARAAALHLLRARGQRDPERWQRTQALRALLEGSTTPRAAAAQLGIDLETPTVVLGVSQRSREAEPAAAARIVDLVTLYCESWHPSALCVADSGVVYALLPSEPATEPPARMMKLVHDISATVRRSGKVDVLVGVGSPAETLTDVPHSRQMADRVLKVLAKRETEGRAGGGVATVEQVRSEVLLQAVAESGAAAPEMLLRPVRTIAEHDAAQGTSYAETLLAYLGAFGDVMRAAEMLSIHQNTMRYRVRRLQTLFDVDLTKGDQLLATWLQLRLLQIREGEPELPPRAPGG